MEIGYCKATNRNRTGWQVELKEHIAFQSGPVAGIKCQHYITWAASYEQPQPMATAVCFQFPREGEGGLLSNKPCWPSPLWQCFLPSWQSLSSLSYSIQGCQQHMMARETKAVRRRGEGGDEGIGRNVEEREEIWKEERWEKKKRGQQQSEAITGRDEERESRQRFAGLGGGKEKLGDFKKQMIRWHVFHQVLAATYSFSDIVNSPQLSCF